MSFFCKVTRGEHVESQHEIYAVAVDESGKVIFSNCDLDFKTYIRSSLKPFQAAASVHAGAVDAAGFSMAELALMCASHNGEEIHVKTAKSMLKKLGFSKDQYECGNHAPYDKNSKEMLIREGMDYSPFNNNCSGKHAGMLALTKHLGVNPDGYTKKDHQVQKTILDRIKTYTGLEEIPTAIDGCSAPTPYMSLFHMAVLFQKLASGTYSELNKVYEAMVTHPYHVAGHNRFDTDFIKEMNGKIVTKVGGEAVRGLAIRTDSGKTYGVALKVLDGSQRANPVATMAILQHLNFIDEKCVKNLQKYTCTELKNHRGIIIGNISAHIET